MFIPQPNLDRPGIFEKNFGPIRPISPGIPDPIGFLESRIPLPGGGRVTSQELRPGIFERTFGPNRVPPVWGGFPSWGGFPYEDPDAFLRTALFGMRLFGGPAWTNMWFDNRFPRVVVDYNLPPANYPGAFGPIPRQVSAIPRFPGYAGGRKF